MQQLYTPDIRPPGRRNFRRPGPLNHTETGVSDGSSCRPGCAPARRRASHRPLHIDLIVRDVAASAPFYEALLGFLGYTRVKQEAALHVWDLVREGTILGGVALRAAHSARPHDRTSAGLHHLAFRAAAPLARAAPTSTALMRG
ncbi:MAG: VOC family protein [Reyranella sp.]|nr:VOC family protein [Reyranella sp.]